MTLPRLLPTIVTSYTSLLRPVLPLVTPSLATVKIWSQYWLDPSSYLCGCLWCWQFAPVVDLLQTSCSHKNQTSVATSPVCNKYYLYLTGHLHIWHDKHIFVTNYLVACKPRLLDCENDLYGHVLVNTIEELSFIQNVWNTKLKDDQAIPTSRFKYRLLYWRQHIKKCNDWICDFTDFLQNAVLNGWVVKAEG